jgi:putative SOS response-associated peptidase YedK
MCHRFIGFTYEQVCAVVDDLNRLENSRVIGAPGQPDPTPDWPARIDSTTEAPMETPGTQAWAIACSAAGTALPSPFLPQQLTWGFTVEWKRGFIYNTRLESALGNKGMWAGFLENGRCLVPAHAFFEPHATERVRSRKTGRPVKRDYLFQPADNNPSIIYLGGVSADGRFSVVTVPPNAAVAAVHNRMPLALTRSEAAWWLAADLPQITAQAVRLLNRNGIALESAPETDEPPIAPTNVPDQLRLF